MLLEGGLIAPFEPRPQGTSLLDGREDGPLATRRKSRREVFAVCSFHEPAFERSQGDAEGIYHLPPRGTPVGRGQHLRSQVLRVSAHATSSHEAHSIRKPPLGLRSRSIGLETYRAHSTASSGGVALGRAWVLKVPWLDWLIGASEVPAACAPCRAQTTTSSETAAKAGGPPTISAQQSIASVKTAANFFFFLVLIA